MSDRILIAYASRSGSTAGAADAIGEVLAQHGAQVDVLPVQDVTDLSPYDAVVVGSAIQGKEWLPEAMDFVRTNQAALRQQPFAAFLLCMTLAMKRGDYRDDVAEWLAPVRALVPMVSEGLFAGLVDASKMPNRTGKVAMRFTSLIGLWEEGDNRDWDAIRAWGQELAGELALAEA